MFSIRDAIFSLAFVAATGSVHAQPVPEIYRYYEPLYGKQLGEYARDQGFNHPQEEIAVIAHELIHIAQAHHNGFYVDGVYAAPYILDPVWRSFPLPTNKDVVTGLSYADKQSVIHRNYAGNTPENRLPNVIDEINAYRLTAPWICQKAPTDRCQKQIVSLTGHLQLAAQHLSFLRKKHPDDAERLRADTAGRLTLRIIGLGVKALRDIGGKALDRTSVQEFAIWE